MPATIHSRTSSLAVALLGIAAAALAAAPARADGPVTGGPAGAPVEDGTLAAPSAAVASGPAPAVLVATTEQPAAGADSVRLAARDGAGAWSTATLAIDPAVAEPTGPAAVAFAASPLAVVRAVPPSGSCTSGAGLYRTSSLTLDPLAATAVLAFEDSPAEFRTWTAPAVAASGDVPVIAALRNTFADIDACAAGTAPDVQPVLIAGSPLAAQALDLDELDATPSAPAIVADPLRAPADAAAVYVGWSEVGEAGLQVIVRRCALPVGGDPETAWSCSPDSDLRTLGPFAAPAGPPAAPALAASADGSVHVAFAVLGPGGRESRYARAASTGPGTWSWDTVRRVERPDEVDPGERLGAAVAVAANGRADVAFIDTAGLPAGQGQAFQVSFAPTGEAGMPVALGDAGVLAAPADAAGPRVAAVALDSAASGDVLAVWPEAIDAPSPGDPDAAVDDALLREGRLAHGSTAPAPASATVTTGKGRPVTVADLLRGADSDGDPVEVQRVADVPGRTSHGTIEDTGASGGRYTPDAGYAGTDSVVLRARELPAPGPGLGWGDPVTRPVVITNTLPTFVHVPGSETVREGATVDVDVLGADPDPTDALGVVVGPTRMLAITQSAIAGGVRLHVRATGRLMPAAAQLVSIRLRDTTETAPTTRTIRVEIAPDWKRVEITGGSSLIGLATARLDLGISDPDVSSRDRRTTADRWEIRWDAGAKPEVVSSDGGLHWTHLYPSPVVPVRHTISVTAFRTRSDRTESPSSVRTFSVTVLPALTRLVRVVPTFHRSGGAYVVTVRLTPRVRDLRRFWVEVTDPATRRKVGRSMITVPATPGTRAPRTRVVDVGLSPLGERRKSLRVTVQEMNASHRLIGRPRVFWVLRR